MELYVHVIVKTVVIKFIVNNYNIRQLMLVWKCLMYFIVNNYNVEELMLVWKCLMYFVGNKMSTNQIKQIILHNFVKILCIYLTFIIYSSYILAIHK